MMGRCHSVDGQLLFSDGQLMVSQLMVSTLAYTVTLPAVQTGVGSARREVSGVTGAEQTVRELV